MKLAELRARLRTALSEDAEAADAAHDLAHADRVWSNAVDIASGEGLETGRVLLCAAYLHDLVALPKDHPHRARAATLSSQAAGPIMAALGLTPTEISAARHAIEAHSFSGGVEPASDAARVLRDADRLEALGAIGVARCFAVSGALGRGLFHHSDPFATARTLDDRTFALDHFATKLLRLPDTFLTETGRTLARARAATMRRYLEELAGELETDGPDW